MRKDSRQEVQPSQVGGSNREAAVADDLGGDTLPDLRLRQSIEWQGEVGMGMDVDEARSEDPSGSVDLSRGGFGPSHLDRRYSSVTDGDINDRGAPPVPSMTVAPRINKSSMRCPSRG